MSILRVERVTGFAFLLGLGIARLAAAQQGDRPGSPGQAAFGAIAEIVRILEADPKTDWSKVDLAALRNHLIDMDHVTLRAQAVATPIPGGLRVEITGDGETVGAIQRMIPNHAGALSATGLYRATIEPRPTGVLLEVTASPPTAAAVARIRGLGFAGLLSLSDHHAVHHLALARGAGAEAHRHH